MVININYVNNLREGREEGLSFVVTLLVKITWSGPGCLHLYSLHNICLQTKVSDNIQSNDNLSSYLTIGVMYAAMYHSNIQNILCFLFVVNIFAPIEPIPRPSHSAFRKLGAEMG